MPAHGAVRRRLRRHAASALRAVALEYSIPVSEQAPRASEGSFLLIKMRTKCLCDRQSSLLPLPLTPPKHTHQIHIHPPPPIALFCFICLPTPQPPYAAQVQNVDSNSLAEAVF